MFSSIQNILIFLSILYVHVLSVVSKPWFMIHGVSSIASTKRLQFIINRATRLVVMVYAKDISTWLLIHVVSIMAFEKEFSQVKNWEKWVVRIQEIFGLQRLLEKIQSDIQKEEEKASCEKSMKEDKNALFKIHESVDEVNSKERDNMSMFLVHKCMDKVNSYWISSTKSVDSSTQSANKALKAQRVVSNKAQEAPEEERCDHLKIRFWL
jgi:hypothetical protein